MPPRRVGYDGTKTSAVVTPDQSQPQGRNGTSWNDPRCVHRINPSGRASGNPCRTISSDYFPILTHLGQKRSRHPAFLVPRNIIAPLDCEPSSIVRCGVAGAEPYDSPATGAC